MDSALRITDEHIVAFLDVGTNSARLLLVRVQPDGSYAVITQQKETVRLGEGAFPEQRLQPEAIDRAVLVCGRFADMARSYGAQEIVAVATAAAREATNREELLRRLRRGAGLEVRVVSGREEARLIHLGVSSGMRLEGQSALFIDIGGGSTELAVGDQRRAQFLDTLKLGAIRLTSHFFLPEETGPVAPARYALVRRYVKSSALRALQRLQALRWDFAVGSSGTIGALAEVAERLEGRREERRRPETLSRERLAQVMTLLCSLPLAERRRVAGLAPERADIIVAGGAILETLMAELAVPELRVSDRGLRDGLLVDFLTRRAPAAPAGGGGIRGESVLRLGRAFGFAEAHARRVTELALELFDSAREAGLHAHDDAARELLGHAALLHDVGVALSFSDHHLHSAYFIRHGDLLGFDETEIAIMAAVARFHRKQRPRKSHPELAGLSARHRRVVRDLARLLTLAENLERSHLGAVRHARLRAVGRRDCVLELAAERDCQLEVWGVQSQVDAFRRAFGRRLRVEATVMSPAPDAPPAG
ncbi:MAG: Ppx/GppA phosphatase family protein [Candidatus Krumholzibacteriia bacterium]